MIVGSSRSLRRFFQIDHLLVRVLHCLVIFSIFSLVSGCGYLPESLRIRKGPATSSTNYRGTWLLVDSKRETLSVMENAVPVKIFHNLAFGSSGVGRKQRRGDNVTPKGVFSIGWVNENSKYYRFWGITYPSLDDAAEGLKWGIISKNEFESIARAHKLGITPPQNTRLGGQIGIHGTGRGSVDIHRIANWTNGCVALENSQIDSLAEWIRPGMIVEIR